LVSVAFVHYENNSVIFFPMKFVSRGQYITAHEGRHHPFSFVFFVPEIDQASVLLGYTVMIDCGPTSVRNQPSRTMPDPITTVLPSHLAYCELSELNAVRRAQLLDNQ